MCFVIFTLLCFVRKIEIFAVTHLFADIMIVLTLIVVVIYGARELAEKGSQIKTVDFINSQTYADAIGFSVYCFEGIGVILPVQDITANPDQYKQIVWAVILTTAIVYIAFGQFCVYAWGDDIKVLITDNLEEGAVKYSVQFLFSINLIFSFPLVLYPAHKIIEIYLYKGWSKTRKRQMSKNVNRTLLVLAICIVTVLLGEKVDKFLSLLGALTCTPIAFSFPAIFHYKACAETPKQKMIDLGLFLVSIIMLVFCASLSIKHWNTE
uniref:Amino acid transporter transmembrane domain-containing protein n=1 Tax=Strombidium rassoulzadegani TaxID=1082188 RepID=A0A7S3G106_9SPIT|mmetsp:Transcript_9660/g.16234  ORF Transcript_9660/g.16234 Transcript_9660/m.16234 type:complete len:266 (+) Transcript_9660:985-1782(+)